MIFIGDIAITKDVNPKIINLPKVHKSRRHKSYE